MKIKIFAIVLSVFMLFCLQITPYADSTMYESYAEEAIAHLVNLNVLSPQFSADMPVTRGQFADAVYKLSDTNLEGDSGYAFYDLEKTNPHYSAIQYCVMASLMSGYEGYIRPDDNITYAEAVAMLIRLLGYGDYANYHGGFPVGYHVTANNIGLIKNVLVNSTDELVRGGSVASMLYNSLHCNVNKMEVIGDDYYSYKPGNVALAFENFGLKYAEGVMTSNGYTDLFGNGHLGDSIVAIDGYAFALSPNMKNGAMLIGQSVGVFYDKDNKVVSVAKRAERNSTLNISRDEFYENNKNSITYLVNGEEATALVNDKTLYFVNGNGTYDLASSGFLTNDYSDLNLVDNNGDGVYDYVFVGIYTTFPIYSVGTDDVISSLTGDTAIDLNCGKSVAILDSKGDEIDASDIRSGAVLSAMEGDKFIYAIVYDGMASGKIEEIGDDYVVLNSLRVPVPNKTAGYFANVKPGQYVDAYFDFLGRIVYVREGFDTDDRNHFGYLLEGGVQSGGLDKTLKIKVYNNKQKMEILNMAEVFSVDGIRYKSSDLSTLPDSFYEGGAIRNEVIVYELNADGEIISVDFPTSALGETEDGFIKTITKAKISLASTGVAAISNTNTAEFLDTDTRIFVIPEDIKKEEDYDVIYLSQTPGGTFIMDMYHFNKNSAFVDVAVIYGNPNPIHTSNSMCVVVSVSEGVDENGDPRAKLVYFDKTKQYTAYATDEKVIEVLRNCTPGDTVRLAVSEETVYNIRKVYDYETDIIADDANTTITSSSSISASVYTESNDSMYCAKAYVVYADGKMIRVDDEFKVYNTSDIFSLRGFLLSSAKVMIVKKTQTGITVEPGTASDISMGDKIVFMSRSARAYHVAIYK